MANMKASWKIMHRVPVRKYGPNLRASVLSRKKPELCSFCSFLRSCAWSGSLLPSAAHAAKAFSCLPKETTQLQTIQLFQNGYKNTYIITHTIATWVKNRLPGIKNIIC